MKKQEIIEFIRRSTPEFEEELRLRNRAKVSFPRPAYARTAACNIQRRMDFEQDQAIQKEWLALVEYIIQVLRGQGNEY